MSTLAWWNMTIEIAGSKVDLAITALLILVGPGWWLLTDRPSLTLNLMQKFGCPFLIFTQAVWISYLGIKACTFGGVWPHFFTSTRFLNVMHKQKLGLKRQHCLVIPKEDGKSASCPWRRNALGCEVLCPLVWALQAGSPSERFSSETQLVAMESQAAIVSPENLASLYYTLAENELSPLESLEILRTVWRVSDPQYPMLNETLLEKVASILNDRYAEQRTHFLDLFGYFRYLAEYLCWDFPITTEILQHSLKDLTPPKEQNFTILWGHLDLAHVLAGLVGLGKGGTRRGQMQLIALRNLVFETMDSHQVSPDFSKNLTVCFILMTLLALVIVPILLLCMFGWSLLTLDWRLVKLRKRVRSHVPQVSLRRWHWVFIVGLGVSFVWIGLIAVDPYRSDLKDHAYRVLRLYLTLAIARLAPILTRIASYWEAYRTVIEFLKGRRPYKVVLAPTWEDLAEKLQGEVKVGKVDCTESAFLGNLFGIRGFPTLKIISEGKMYTFTGRRSLDSLQEWAQGGYKEQEAVDYPFDKPSNKWMAILTTSMTNYGIYGIGVTLICLGILFCYLDSSGSPEDAKSRKEMEERLKKLQEAGNEKKAEKEESKKDS
eukprot:s742_g14.t3